MRIVEVRTIPLHYEEPVRERDALAVRAGSEHPMDVLLVEVATDEGLIGLGEAYAYASLETVQAAIHELLGPVLLDEDPLAIGHLWQRMYRSTFRQGRRGAVICALSGLDIALWDLLGKATGLPVATLLGGGKDRVAGYVTGGYYATGKDLTRLREEVAQAVAQGYGGFKLKVGAAPLSEDTLRLEVCRDVLGPDRLLAADANCALSYSEALALGRVMDRLGAAFFEEPVSTDQPAVSARLAQDLSVPIAGYETETTRFGMRPFIVEGGVDVVQADAIWTGGLTEARRIAELADTFGLDFIPHFSAGAVALTANLHLVAAMPNGRYQETHLRPNALRDELFVTPLHVVDGELVVPTSPGLGVELRPDTIDRYRSGPGVRLRH